MPGLPAGCGWFYNNDGYWCQGSWNGDQFSQQCVHQHCPCWADHDKRSPCGCAPSACLNMADGGIMALSQASPVCSGIAKVISRHQGMCAKMCFRLWAAC